MSRTMKLVINAVLATGLSVLAACASGRKSSEKDGLGDPPRSFADLPSIANDGVVYAQATFYTNHDAIFGKDLIVSQGIVPIALKLGVRGDGSSAADIRPSLEDMNLRLYLQDGTPLVPVSADQITTDDRNAASIIQGEAFQGGLLDSWDKATERFVFFRLPDRKEYSAKDNSISRNDGDAARTLDLTKSLCAFNVTIQHEMHPFYLGLQKGRRAPQK